jgi:hypothetical protein
LVVRPVRIRQVSSEVSQERGHGRELAFVRGENHGQGTNGE